MCAEYLSDVKCKAKWLLLTQCLKCQVFGHFTRNCNNLTKCKFCAEIHASKECTKQNKKDFKCINCIRSNISGSTFNINHRATDESCPYRAKYIEKMQLNTFWIINTQRQYPGGTYIAQFARNTERTSSGLTHREGGNSENNILSWTLYCNHFNCHFILFVLFFFVVFWRLRSSAQLSSVSFFIIYWSGQWPTEQQTASLRRGK